MVAIKYGSKLVVKALMFFLRLIIYFISFLLISIMSLSGTLLAPVFILFLIALVVFLFVHMWESAAITVLLLFLAFLCYVAGGALVVGLAKLAVFLRCEDF